MPRFAANLTMMFAERAFLDRFSAARAAGFRAVEILFPYDHPAELIAERASENGLEVVLVNAPPGDWTVGERGLAALTSRAAEFRASIDLALDYASALGSPQIHVLAGLADPANRVAREAYGEALRFACDRAARLGVDVLIEPINDRDMPGYFLRDFEFAAKLIENLALPNLKLQFDFYHRQILRGDVIRGLEQLMPIIGHVQIASVPGRSEPGSGELDDGRIFSTLDRLGYRGYVGCEYRPSGVTEDGLGWLAPYLKPSARPADSR